MANTLTNLIPTFYAALDVVSRKRKGLIPAVTRDSSIATAALNQSVRVPIVPATTAEADNTPATTAPDTGDQTIGNVEITISKSKHIPIRWTGEETRGLLNAGTYNEINQKRVEQAIERLDNLIETDLASTYKYASRAHGTAGTTPFGTANDYADFAGVMRILDDNGAPTNDLKMVLSNAAMQNIRAKQSSLFKVNEAGTDELLRDGKVMRVMGMDIGQSGFIASHTKGTNSGGGVNNATYAVGATTLTLQSAGTGNFLEGDMIEIATENAGIYYGVRSGDTNVADGGTITLNNPGLQVAIGASNRAITTQANYRANLVFSQSAIVLVTRTPAKPALGDAAQDIATVTDPLTGLVYEFAHYPQFHQSPIHVRIAWGWQAIKQEHICVLFG